MKKFRPGSHAISGAFVFLLLGVFAVFALLMVLLSAKFYRGTVQATELHNDQRAAANYLMNTIHAADQRGAVAVQDGMLVITWPFEAGDQSEDPDEADDLSEDEEYTEDTGYETRIYCHEGVLRELLISGGSTFDPADGEAICALQSFEPSLDGQMLTISYTDETGASRTLHVLLYCGEVAQ